MSDVFLPVSLEKIVDSNNLKNVRSSAINAMFSADPADRRINIRYLDWFFGGNLRGCYPKNGVIILELSSEEGVRMVHAAYVPNKCKPFEFFPFYN